MMICLPGGSVNLREIQRSFLNGSLKQLAPPYHYRFNATLNR